VAGFVLPEIGFVFIGIVEERETQPEVLAAELTRERLEGI